MDTLTAKYRYMTPYKYGSSGENNLVTTSKHGRAYSKSQELVVGGHREQEYQNEAKLREFRQEVNVMSEQERQSIEAGMSCQMPGQLNDGVGAVDLKLKFF